MNEPAGSPSILQRLLALMPDPALRTKAGLFAMVGVVNASVDFAVFAFCHLYLGLGLVIANILSWVVAVTGSYVLNSTITFAAESGRVLRVKDYLSFAASQAAGLLANTVTVVALSYLVPVLVAKFLAIGVSFLVNFSLTHFVVFPAHRAGAPETARKSEPADR